MYNPRLARFPSVDPLTSKYPFYTPYQFAGNMPIEFIDLDGAEPANNPKSTDAKGAIGKATVQAILSKTAEHDFMENIFSKGTYTGEKLLGVYVCSPNAVKGVASTRNSDYVTDNTSPESATKLNLYVSNNSIFNVDESNASKFDNYEAFVVDNLVANFISGQGPENYNFPTNGIISSKFYSSDIFNAALKDYKSGKLKPNETRQYSFGIVDLFRDAVRNWTPFNITGMAGSGTITFIPNKDGIFIRIFNITSLSSGAFIKNPNNINTFPASYVRDPVKTTEYGNISQTYNLFIPNNSSLLKP